MSNIGSNLKPEVNPAPVNGTQDNYGGGQESINQQNEPLTHFHSFFYDLVTWKFPRATSCIFFSLLSAIFAFRFINVMRYVFKAAYLLLGTVAALESIGKAIGYKGIVSQMRPRRYHTISRESLESIFEESHDFINFVVVEFQRIVFVENIFTTVAAFLSSFFGYFLIKYLPFWSLAFLGTIIAFTGPYIYINNQEAIDNLANQYGELANQKFIEARGYGEQYAEEVVNRAKVTASQLTEQVQNYAGRGAATTTKKPAVSAHEFPPVLAKEPVIQTPHEQPTPILA